MRRICATWMVLALSGAAVLVRAQERELDCRDRGRSGEHETYCEMREVTLAAAGRLEVDGRTNGGVSVKGWSRSDVLVRAQVQTQAGTEAEARGLAGQVHVVTAASQVRADGPSLGRHQSWSVSYEVFVPRRTDLSLKTHNGGIRIADVQGRMEFDAVNGGVSLLRLAGTVRGQTTNGGLKIELAGNRWDGEEMDATTTNGGVTLWVPEQYSARLESGTVNGHIQVDFPVTVQGEVGRRLSLTLGAGGPLVRARTTNGGVSIRRKA